VVNTKPMHGKRPLRAATASPYDAQVAGSRTDAGVSLLGPKGILPLSAITHWRRDLIPSSGAEALMSFVMAGLSAAQRPCQRSISLRLHGSTRPCSKNTLRELAIELLRGVVTSGYPSTCPNLCARPARQRVASRRRCSFWHLDVTRPGSLPLRRSQLSSVACGTGGAYLGTSLPLELPRRVGLLHKKEGATEVPVALPDLAPWVGRVTNRLLPFRMAVARDGRRLISPPVPKAGRSQP